MFSSKEKDEEQNIYHAVLTTEEMLRLSVVYLQCSSSFVSLTFLPTRQELYIMGSDWEEKLISTYVKTLNIC